MLDILLTFVSGGICGSIAGNIMKTGFSFLGNMVLGIIGSFVGAFIFGMIGLSVTGLIGSILCGVLGSCVVIWIARKAKHKL